MATPLCHHQNRKNDMNYNQEIYQAYLLSERWLFELKPQRLKADNLRCRLCNRHATQVHHRVYPDILGTETIDDLTSLCEECHKNYHFPPSVEDVSQQILERAKEKAQKCPVCHRVVRVYPRSLNHAMAAAMIHIYRYFERDDAKEWLHVENYLKSLPISAAIRGDYGKLRFFETLAKEPLLLKGAGKREDGSSRNGFWKITNSGKAFVRGEVKVPKAVYLYNDERQAVSAELIDIHAALAKKFDYNELMTG